MGQNTPFDQKHPNKTVDPHLARHIKALAQERSISCAAAHKAARKTGEPPEKIGEQIDLLGYRISLCQLGLFGYGSPSKKLNPEMAVPPDLDQAIHHAAEKTGRISCRQCWDIATKLTKKRLDIGSACEKKGVRIKPCQLGAF